MNSTNMLVVKPKNYNSGLTDLSFCASISYSFVEADEADQGADVIIDVQGTETDCRLNKSFQGFEGGFSQQVLNRTLAQTLIHSRPKGLLLIGLCGCTLDLPRIAAFLNVPVCLMLLEPLPDEEAVDEQVHAWMTTALKSCAVVLASKPLVRDSSALCWQSMFSDDSSADLPIRFDQMVVPGNHPSSAYDYSSYEFCQRDHALLLRMQQGDANHFTDCKQVLDLACGAGIFLQCLATEGIKAVGVERNEAIADYGRGMGFDIITADALDYLRRTDEKFDGIYCSHFIEHLPVEAVQELLAVITNCLTPDGVLILVFPDPESIRSQLLGFWRDPEHVRFYHPELVTAMATSSDLVLEWSSYQSQPHRVYPFSEFSKPVSSISPAAEFEDGGVDAAQQGWLDKILGGFGLAGSTRLQSLENTVENLSRQLSELSSAHASSIRQLDERTERLWQVNETWAWNDNVTLKFRKRD